MRTLHRDRRKVLWMHLLFSFIDCGPHRFGLSSKSSDQLQLALEMSEIFIAALTARLHLPEDSPAD